MTTVYRPLTRINQPVPHGKMEEIWIIFPCILCCTNRLQMWIFTAFIWMYSYSIPQRKFQNLGKFVSTSTWAMAWPSGQVKLTGWSKRLAGFVGNAGGTSCDRTGLRPAATTKSTAKTNIVNALPSARPKATQLTLRTANKSFNG